MPIGLLPLALNIPPALEIQKAAFSRKSFHGGKLAYLQNSDGAAFLGYFLKHMDRFAHFPLSLLSGVVGNAAKKTKSQGYARDGKPVDNSDETNVFVPVR